MKKLRNAQLTELPQTVEIERKKLSTETTLVRGSINYCELYLNRRTNLIITSASSKEVERLRERLYLILIQHWAKVLICHNLLL